MNEYTILSGLGQTDPRQLTNTLEDQYASLRGKCAERYGWDFCNAVLPRSMVYAVTRRKNGQSIPWWGWMILGGIVGRFLR